MHEKRQNKLCRDNATDLAKPVDNFGRKSGLNFFRHTCRRFLLTISYACSKIRRMLFRSSTIEYFAVYRHIFANGFRFLRRYCRLSDYFV